MTLFCIAFFCDEILETNHRQIYSFEFEEFYPLFYVVKAQVISIVMKLNDERQLV